MPYIRGIVNEEEKNAIQNSGYAEDIVFALQTEMNPALWDLKLHVNGDLVNYLDRGELGLDGWAITKLDKDELGLASRTITKLENVRPGATFKCKDGLGFVKTCLPVNCGKGCVAISLDDGRLISFDKEAMVEI